MGGRGKKASSGAGAPAAATPAQAAPAATPLKDGDVVTPANYAAALDIPPADRERVATQRANLLQTFKPGLRPFRVISGSGVEQGRSGTRQGAESQLRQQQEYERVTGRGSGNIRIIELR